MSTEIRCDKCGEITDAALIWTFVALASPQLQREGYGKEHSDLCHICKLEWFNPNVYAAYRKKVIP